MTITRRSLLNFAALAPAMSTIPRLARAVEQAATEKPDYTFRIATGLVELAPDHIVSTTLYNGQFPGPPLRFKEGQRVIVDILNDTDTPELVHWHGQMIPTDVDGASEEGTPFVPAHGMRRLSFVPKPSGFRFYHTHVIAGGDLNRGTYTGQAGRVYIEPKNNPGAYDREIFGVWVMGDLDDDDRRRGMGIVVEYAGRSGKPQWIKPKPFRWDYTHFGRTDAKAGPPDETIEMTIVKHNAALNGFNQWTLNGEAFSMETMKPIHTVHEGRSYRIKFRNASDDIHPLHLHRHSFELTRVAGKSTAGVLKDVVMLGGFQELEFDFVADNPGLTLFHCHQQLHMDFGFMALFKYA